MAKVSLLLFSLATTTAVSLRETQPSALYPPTRALWPYALNNFIDNLLAMLYDVDGVGFGSRATHFLTRLDGVHGFIFTICQTSMGTKCDKTTTKRNNFEDYRRHRMPSGGKRVQEPGNGDFFHSRGLPSLRIILLIEHERKRGKAHGHGA